MNLIYFLLFVFLRSVASEDTRLAFHSFSAEDDNFITLGDTAHNGVNGTYFINKHSMQSRGTCGALVYGKKVHFQDVAAGRVASFSTSFSFTFRTFGLPRDNSTSPGDEVSGMFFVLIKDTVIADTIVLMSEPGSFNPCWSPLHPNHPNHKFSRPSVIILFGMGRYDPGFEDASISYIRISKTYAFKYDIRAYTHNLCGNDTYCSYFSDGKIFTAWIDFNSSSHTLEVRLAHGSDPGVKKPTESMLRIPNYRLPELLGDYGYLSILGSSDNHRVEVHELLSWRFFKTDISGSIVPSSQTPNPFWKVKTWVGISTGVLGMVVAVAVALLWSISRLGNPSRSYRYTPLGHNGRPHVFSYAELQMATDNFDERNLLGKGGSGSVYKGSFETPSGVHFVAVKHISFSEPKQAESLFHAEVASLGQIRHRNVVQLQGWCQEKGRLLLVYDFMPNGSLSEWLHTSADQELGLSLKMRHSILEGVGSALEYLHEDCSSCVLHRDIKSSNVLLDADFKAHLGDFGLARLMDHDKLDKSTLAAGTLGYMAPELPYTGKATKESDVYSFGILVLEVVCGRRPLDMCTSDPEDLVLLHMVWRAHEGEALLNVADQRLVQTLQPLRFAPHEEDGVTNASTNARRLPPLLLDSNIGSGNNVLVPSMVVGVDVQVNATMVVDLLRLGLLCCLPNPKARPSMGQVNGILQQIGDMENLSSISNIAMPFLPASKPLGVYHSLEFSQTSLTMSSSSPPILKAHTKLLVDRTSFGNFHKND